VRTDDNCIAALIQDLDTGEVMGEFTKIRAGAGNFHNDRGLVERVGEGGNCDCRIGGSDALHLTQEPGTSLGTIGRGVVAVVEPTIPCQHKASPKDSKPTYSVRVRSQLWGPVFESWAIKALASV
jgi:hypothetical protein